MSSDITAQPPDEQLIAAVAYTSRSKVEEEGKDSTGDQAREILARIGQLGGRMVVGESFADHASGFTGNRGPGLADALDAAKQLVRERGKSELWVVKSERLGRGTGSPGEARALGALLYELRAAGVTVRSVHDDELVTNEMLWGFLSKMASDYSKGLSTHTRRGKRSRAEKGKWCASYVPDGYIRLGRIGDPKDPLDGLLDFDPERRMVIELIWALALDGSSCESIQLALSSRGYRTSFRGKARPFDTQRVSQILNTCAYAGIVKHKGEVLPVQALWPRYVEPEDWHRLQRERAERSGTTKRSRGRQATRHLLRGLAVCGECGGPMIPQTERKLRDDGTRRRYYQCKANKDYHRESAEWCPALPIDGEVADSAVLHGLDGLLADADALREGLNAGRQNECEKLEDIASRAQAVVAKCDKAVARADELAGEAFANDDTKQQETLLAIATQRRAERERALTRLNAALDAISELDSYEPVEDVQTRLLAALSGSLKEAEGDLVRLNAALREWLETVVLQREADGSVTLLPRLSAEAAKRLINDRSPRVSGSVAGYPIISALAGGANVGDYVEVVVEMPVAEGESRADAEAKLANLTGGQGFVEVSTPVLKSNQRASVTGRS